MEPMSIVQRDGIVAHVARDLLERSGILVAFTERTGGVSAAPYASLDLAGHVGDDPGHVDENRRLLMRALDALAFRDRLTLAEQVHGVTIVDVDDALAGSGAYATEARTPVPGADALLTDEPGTPLMLLFADCVPVVLVSERPRAIAVVHAGWRGLAAGIVSRAAARLAAHVGAADRLTAYVGPHIGPCCYEVGDDVVSRFVGRSATIPRVSGRLDLGAVVRGELIKVGIAEERQWHLGICTADNLHRFYSYRAEGRTGRHAAVALIVL